MYRFLIILLLVSVHVAAQQDSTKNKFEWDTYAEAYYSHDFGKPADQQKIPFLYSYNRHQKLSLNLIVGRVSYTAKRFRSVVALAAGTYMDDNLQAEDAVLGQVFEAYVGFKLSKHKEWWLDMGILPSHIGFESAIGADQLTLTRSMMADNSPYYESGFRLSYNSANQKWFLGLLCVNGWQRSIRVGQSFQPAFGHQLTYKPNHTLSINSSSFIGNDRHPDFRRMRYFHNLYANWQLNKNWLVTAGFDIGWEQQTKGSSKMYHWYSPVLILAYQIIDHHRLAMRAEYYQDIHKVIISSPSSVAFKTFGYSINYDYKISPSMMFRIEARSFSSAQPVFPTEAGLKSDNFFMTSSVSIRL
ncbi:MAG: porin [Sediminibacterium sp.]